MGKSASLPYFLVAWLVKFTFISTISLSDFDFKLYKLSLSENICFLNFFFQEILIELSTIDVSFGTSCKHAISPITRFLSVSFDWSIEKCHRQINVAGRYVWMSKMNLYLSPRCSLWRKLFYKSNRKLFSCVCIAWYKHSRGWEVVSLWNYLLI